jgi:hypothetical protein
MAQRVSIARVMGAGWPARFPIVQFPNPPLILALLADLAGRVVDGTPHRAALAVYYIALGVWAYEEAIRGENWFRRVLGVGIGALLLVSLTDAVHA